MIPEPFDPGDRFRDAARAFLLYALTDWLGGSWLTGEGGSSVGPTWLAVGVVVLVAIPYMLRRRRAWFERWVLGRRDFARLLAVVMLARAAALLRLVLDPEAKAVALGWSEAIVRAGAAGLFVLAIIAMLFVAVAAWSTDQQAVA